MLITDARTRMSVMCQSLELPVEVSIPSSGPPSSRSSTHPPLPKTKRSFKHLPRPVDHARSPNFVEGLTSCETNKTNGDKEGHHRGVRGSAHPHASTSRGKRAL